MPIIDHSRASEVPWRPGYRKWDITRAEHGVTSTFSLNTAEPGAGAPLHTHVMDELIVIVEGRLEVRIDGETQLVGKDHTLVIPQERSTGLGSSATNRPSFWFSSRRWSPMTPSIPTTWKERLHLQSGVRIGLKCLSPQQAKPTLDYQPDTAEYKPLG